MAFKVISRAHNQITPTSQDAGDESIANTLGRNVYRVVPRVLESTIGLPGNIEKLVGSAIHGVSNLASRAWGAPETAGAYHPTLPTSEYVREKVTQPLQNYAGINPAWSNPHNEKEKFLDDIYEQLPMLAVGGFAQLPTSVARAVFSHGGAKLAEKSGAGPVGTIAASLAGGVGFDFLKNTGLKGVRNLGIRTMKESYDKARQAATGKSIDASALHDELKEEFFTPKKWADLTSKERNEVLAPLKQGKKIDPQQLKDIIHMHDNNELSSYKFYKLKLGHGIKSTEEKELMHQLNKLESNIHRSGDGYKMDINQAWELKKGLNELANRTPKKTPERFFYENLSKKIQDKVLLPAAEKYKEFGENYLRGNNLYTGLYGANALRKIVEGDNKIFKLVKQNPQLALLIGGGKFLYSPISTTKKVVGGLAAKQSVKTATRAYDFYTKSSEARKLFKDLTRNALEDNKEQVLLDIIALNKSYDAYEEKESLPGKKTFKVISRAHQ